MKFSHAAGKTTVETRGGKPGNMDAFLYRGSKKKYKKIKRGK